MLSLMSSPVAVFAAEEVLAPPNARWLWVFVCVWTVVVLGGSGFVGFKAWQDIRSVAVTAMIVMLGLIFAGAFGALALTAHRSEVAAYEALPLLRVASDLGAPQEALSELAGHSRVDVRSAVAANPTSPEDVLLRLAADHRVDVRSAVAANPSSPEDVFKALAGSSDESVRAAVALNAAADVETLAVLAQDQSVWVRGCVAENPAASRQVLLSLAADPDPGVRAATVGHPALGADGYDLVLHPPAADLQRRLPH